MADSLTKCQNCHKFYDCKNLDQSGEKCVALERTDFRYDCPFYTGNKPVVKIDIEEEDFAKATPLEFMEWLQEQRLNVRVVGYLTSGEKYDLTKTMIKNVINKLKKLEQLENAEH